MRTFRSVFLPVIRELPTRQVIIGAGEREAQFVFRKVRASRNLSSLVFYQRGAVIFVSVAPLSAVVFDQLFSFPLAESHRTGRYFIALRTTVCISFLLSNGKVHLSEARASLSNEELFRVCSGALRV
ncbi:hypothetical protein L596_004076 [Steinernema carpocapsae]|uniref:Uncharacterized protein n=1 Tax=Steinernema carpocapsae TaxID=34508 RepID=A0A4U8UW82_STECR|nr:hypothetical protein L596_004076 [Steinernema carpocapsae]